MPDPSPRAGHLPGGAAGSPTSLPPSPSRPFLLRLALLGLAAWVSGLVLLLPAVALVGHTDFENLSEAWASAAGGPLETSLGTAAIALTLTLLLGTPLSYWLARRARGMLRPIAEGLLLIPLMMPPLVVGLVLVFLLGPGTPIGAFARALGVGTVNSPFALVLASFYEAAPYYVFAAAGAFATVDPVAEHTALTFGLTPVQVFGTITLPRVAPGLAAGAAMAWARAVGAFGASLVVAYHPTGLPVGIWIALEEVGLPAAFPLALLLLVVALPLPLALRTRWSHAPV